MALVRSDPFGEIERFFQQMWPTDGRAHRWSMPMDAFRKGDEYLVLLDLPGVDVDSVDITMDDKVLTVKVERPAPQTEEGMDRLVMERPYGTFTRQLMLGENLDAEKMTAEYDDGVLRITIPVVPNAQPKRIQVTKRSAQQQLSHN
jgi:HSP20 family protein